MLRAAKRLGTENADHVASNQGATIGGGRKRASQPVGNVYAHTEGDNQDHQHGQMLEEGHQHRPATITMTGRRSTLQRELPRWQHAQEEA